MYLEQLPSGSWRVTVKDAGHVRRGTRKTKGEARRLGAQMLLELGGAPVGCPTVDELLDAHLADATYGPRTRVEIDRARESLPSAFARREVTEVTAIVVKALWRELDAAGVSRHRIKRLRDLLSKAWQSGLGEWEGMPANPFPLAPPPATRRAKRIEPPAPEQVRALIAGAGTRPLALWLRLAAVTGARRGELCGLRWDDVRFDRGEVVIRSAVTEVEHVGVVEGDTKTGERGHRVVPLDLPTVAGLRRRTRIVGCPWVFTFDGVSPWRPSYVTREFGRIAGRVEVSGVRVHDLRHFAATQWLGVQRLDVATVAYLLGHSSPATTLRIYAHHIPAQGRTAVVAHAAVLDG
jgi:integrase